ncbi:UbiA family prenyltransferase [Acidovorax sp. sic0104]|uniref:UbiA family prenyltransferase n=1 Tax=Acidovorax sp. sic0104 TaxID=2854784 RepID=UPI0030D7B3A6
MNRTQVPLVVDLDGTLIKTDLLAETANSFILAQPWRVFQLLAWLAAGRATLKSRLAQASAVDPSTLPFNEDLLAWLREEKRQGRCVVLATASHQLLADKVAAHLGLFDEVLATRGTTNLKAHAKRDALVARFGEGGFDYVGNDRADLPVWASAAQSHVVCGLRGLLQEVRRLGRHGREIAGGRPPAGAMLLRAMRPHQWVKNLLVLVPLMTAHRYGDATSLVNAGWAFVVFCLTASSVYLLNDLADLDDDRQHGGKRKRPLASGNLGLAQGWAAWPALLVVALALAGPLLPWPFTATLAAYFVSTAAYSWWLKQIPVIDVLALAGLYTLRIVAGAAAIGVPLSFWLLAFSMFLFFSLALLKRYGELRAVPPTGSVVWLRGRGYDTQDLGLIASLGGAAGYIAVLVLALYIQDEHTARLYTTPAFIWLACPLLLYWVSRAWLIAHRGHMHEDPVVFALRDRASWAVAGLLALAFVLARVVA